MDGLRGSAAHALTNDGVLGQSLYMLNNPPSAAAQSVIRQNINALSHRQGKTVINLYDDHSVDLRSFGRTSATHSQGNHTGTGLVDDIGCGIEHGNIPSDPSLCPEWEKEMYELFNGDNNEMFQLGMIQSMQASNPYVEFDDDLSPTKQKRAGKVRVGLATKNPRYTTIIDDAPPDMLSQDLYGRTLKCAAHDNTPPMKKSHKKKKESPIPSDSSDSED